MFYLALGYFISYIPDALLAKALPSGIVPGVDTPVSGLVLLPAAALGQLLLIRAGSTVFLGTPGALYAAGIGALYAVGSIFGTPIAGAVAALSYPVLRDSLRGAASPSERMALFVCGGNQSRSAMAECIARAAMDTTRSGYLVTITSAGLKVHAPGAPMTEAAYAVLQEAGVIPPRYRSRPLTPELCRRADAIYCMTVEHCAAVLALAPDVADRTHCLAGGDLPELSATSLDDHRRTPVLIQQAVRSRLVEQFS